MSEQRPYTTMDCKETGKSEVQYVVRESEDGITLRCGGCGDIHSHEIGFFADLYEEAAKARKLLELDFSFTRMELEQLTCFADGRGNSFDEEDGLLLKKLDNYISQIEAYEEAHKVIISGKD